MGASQRRLAAMQLAKDATRIATKIAISEAVKQQNNPSGSWSGWRYSPWKRLIPAVGNSAPVVGSGPRVPCPAGLKSYTVVFKERRRRPLG